MKEKFLQYVKETLISKLYTENITVIDNLSAYQFHSSLK